MNGFSRRQQPAKNALSNNGDSASTSSPIIPIDLQQLLLNIFKNAFHTRLESDIKPLLQEVKQHLYNREFAAAFSKEEYLEAYAARWSPSRALNYLSIFQELRNELRPFGEGDESGVGEGEVRGKTWKVVCLGGGAGAEIVALGGFAKMLGVVDETKKEENVDGAENSTPPAPSRVLEIHTLDVAPWSTPLSLLTTHLTTAPPLSPYASQALKTSNKPLLPPASLSQTFTQANLLTLPISTLRTTLANTHLVTLMFTLNELYSASVAQTQTFLMRMTECLGKGAMLLVVDSPGSYAMVKLGGEEKEYPMRWLVDFTLLGKNGDGGMDGGGERTGWEKVKEEESRWFRMSREELKYPIELENGRVQLHLYRRV
ncbi:hypothetical protein DM02DRAFT_718841 [Periconia macrospinosa]|uniref:25S rRNA (Uridine(2843)-N(3))-methyltransferase n=1 Tax=Periconia macrospinosa TaxID=97972 RepID=A0A2V1DQK0_9PLEO|nr:hypothetical protein DM02DRAFT_718841 [Periconia macrospinosa]